MNIDLEALEGIEVYNSSNFKESDLFSPLCFIIDGVVEIEPFNILLKDLQGFKPIAIQIFEFVYFLSLEIGINDFKIQFFKKFQSMNYSLRSFFLKKSISESIINHFPFVKEHVYYLFYEEKENNILNTEIFPSTIKIQTISKHPRKTLYEFSNFSELSSNYTKIMQTQKKLSIYALLPINFSLNKQQKIENSFKFTNNINLSTYPLFSPFQSIYYVSFIEQFPPKPQRKMNVEEIYYINHIFDAQISHLLQFEPNNVRTFLGFDNKFRCLHVFDYFINQKCFKKVIFINNNNQIESPELINIKYNLFYIEIQNILDSSLLFSIDYQNSFLFNNDSFCSNDFSTFLSFEKEEEMKKAKRMIKSLTHNSSSYAIKMLKLIDQKDFLLLFPNEKLNENLFYMIIRLKYFNKTDISKINNEFLRYLQNVSKIVRYDKQYFVVGFDNNQKRNDIFLNLKSKQSMLIHCYYNENLPNRKKMQINVKGKEKYKIKKEQNIIKKEPLFKPKDGLFYIYFEEYQRSKLNYPSKNVRPLFGIKNIADLQRNFFLPDDPKEYTFVGFAKEENVIELINQISLKQHIISTNALDGKIYRFINNNKLEKIDTNNNESPNRIKDSNKSNSITQISITNTNKVNTNSNTNSNAIKLNKDSHTITQNKNTNSKKVNQNKNTNIITPNSNINSNAINKNNCNNPNKTNQNSNNSSDRINQNSSNYSNEIIQNIKNYSNELNQNTNNYSNELNQNTNNYSNELNQNSNNYSNKINQNTNNHSNEINQNTNNYSNKINQNTNNHSNEINQNNNNYSNEINQNSNNHSNEINQNNNNYSNEINQNINNYSNEINQNIKNYSNEINQNNNNYSNEINQNNNNNSNENTSNNISNSNNDISKRTITKVSEEKHNPKIAKVKKENKNNKEDKTHNADIAENDNKTPIQNKIDNNIYYDYINQEENSYLKIDLKKYELKNHIGNGQFGDVFIVEEKSTKKKYAAKISISNKLEDFIQEIYFYSKYKYPLILSIRGYSLTDFNNKQRITMVLDYMPNGSLEEALNKPNSLSKPDKYLIMYGIVIGMKYLHSQSVVHRDLKPANILLDENNYPRICDFGLSIIYSDRNQIVKKQEKRKVGSHMFMAPEIFLDKEPYSFKVDVYAFSMIAYQLLTNKEPYSDKKYKSIGKFKKDIIDGVRPDISFIPDTEIQSFFQRCWSQEPTERPSFSQIYEMITTYKFRSVFEVNDYYIPQFDCWYESILSPFELDDSIISNIEKKFPSHGIKNYISSIFPGNLKRFGKYGYQLFYGIGVPRNGMAGLAIMAFAGGNGDIDSLYHFARCFHIVRPYDSCFFEFLKKAADQGHLEAMNEYAKLLLENNENNIFTDMEAAEYFQMSANRGSAVAMCCYGSLLDLGIGVEKDRRKALEYFKLSSELGCTEGIYQYAFHIENGLGCQIDYEKASKYYEIASFYGDFKSMICLGKMFYNGKLQFNIDQSIKYLREASKYEDAKGMFEYGKALMIQVINKKDDINLPIKCYLKSIGNNSDACFSYGNLILLNALFRFLENANSIDDSIYYFQLALAFSEIEEIPKSFLVSLINLILNMKNVETLIVEYGMLILKNTLENHDLIIDCLLYFMIVKYFKQQYLETLNKTIEKEFPNKSNYLKYIIECIDSYSYFPYSNKRIEDNNNDNDDEINELKAFTRLQVKNKDIKDVKVNIYESFVLDAYCCFSFSQSTIPKDLLREVDKYFKKLPEFKSVHPYVCNPEDSNDLFTYYLLNLFSSKAPVNEFYINFLNEFMTNKDNENWEVDKKDGMTSITSYIRITQIHMQFEPIFERKGFQVLMGFCSGMPLDNSYLYFDENYLSKDLLNQLLNYLHVIKDIRSIQRNVYNGRQIVTMIYIQPDTEKAITKLIKNFLSPKDVLFKTFEYPLQSTIVLNEKMIFKDEKDFLCILNEIESIGIKPINVERDKLYLYEEFYLRKLFQKFSFICFKNEIDKMRALNHINSIVYKGKKNVLNYNLDLHYASLNDRCFPKYVRDLVPQIFQQIKGFRDIQRYVLSIESPVERTYVGFDSPKHLKKCYYKFTYKKNLIHFRINNDNVFWRKNNYKYLMIESSFYKKIFDKNPDIIEQIKQSSKDFQENCKELDQISPEIYKRIIPVYYNFIGYESNEDLDNAFNFLENHFPDSSSYYRKYHEGYSWVDVTYDPKEAYLFYNSL